MNSSSRAAGSRSESSRRNASIPSWWASCHAVRPGSSGASTNTRTSSWPGSIAGSSPCCSSTARCTAPGAETLLHLVVDDPFDHGLLGPFHGASTRIRPPG